MEYLGYLIGGGLIVVVAVDAFMTILLLSGGGFLTKFWMSKVWGGALMIHRRRPIHGFLQVLGPLMTISTVILWYVLILLGWSLIFISGTNSVMVNTDSLPTDIMQRIYFTGTTLSGVGYGDLVPTEAPWTILANLSAFTTTFIITTSLSYLLPVVSAALERRQMAEEIHSIGKSAPEIIEHSWTRDNGELMNDYWMAVIATLGKHANKHLVYPVLHYFHSPEAHGASSLAILRMADAMFLIEQVEDARGSNLPPPVFHRILRAALEAFASIKGRKMNDDFELGVGKEHEILNRDVLTNLGFVPVGEDEFDRALEEYKPLRAKLANSCLMDGWDPSREDRN